MIIYRATIDLHRVARHSQGPALLAALVALLLPFGFTHGDDLQPAAAARDAKENQPVVITIVYDNVPVDKELKTAWGFACVVEGFSETILFDTGGEGELLLANMAKAGFKPAEIQSIVLSHFHRDHTGGLDAFLKVHNKVKVFVPKAFPADFREQVGRSGAEVVQTEGPCKVCDGAWTTGVLDRGIAEQGLCLKTSEGLVVVTGCAHPGIVNMAKAASEHAKKPVWTVLGGFHMSRASPDEIAAVIRDLREMGVKQAGPSHCSGNKIRELMKEAFGPLYLDSGLGARIRFDGKP